MAQNKKRMQFLKRQRELKKAKKKEEKRLRRQQRREEPVADDSGAVESEHAADLDVGSEEDAGAADDRESGERSSDSMK